MLHQKQPSLSSLTRVSVGNLSEQRAQALGSESLDIRQAKPLYFIFLSLIHI